MGQSKVEPLLLTVDEARVLCNIGRSRMWQEIHAGRIPSVRFGKAVRIPREALLRWIEAQTKQVG